MVQTQLQSSESHAEQAFEALAALAGPIDTFFEDIMIMTDDASIRNNRLQLLAELKQRFTGLADFSLLSPT